MEEELAYVANYMVEEPGRCAIAATVSMFGWERLAVECVCLYVDAAGETERLIELAKAQPTPTIIKEGVFDLLSCEEEVRRLLQPPELDKSVQRERNYELRKNLPRVHRAINKAGPFAHGQSFSRMGSASKASCAVFLSPNGKDGGTYALTAAHGIAPHEARKDRKIVSPGGLDILTQLYASTKSGLGSDEREMRFLLERWNQPCGSVEHHHIGETDAGWRSDWA
jgi:hypothetical protein